MTGIGHNPPRPDGFPKVSGAARYADDFRLPGMLYGATVRSPHPHARIESLQWQSEKAPAGAVFVSAADLPGPNGVQLLDDSWPILAADTVRHVGEPVALVAAPSRLAARQALAAVAVEYSPLSAVTEADAATEILYELEFGRGEVETVLAQAETEGRLVEGTYRTGHQEHIYIECQAMTAWLDGERDGGLVVNGTLQCPYYVQNALEHAFPDLQIRVQASAVGGGFGGKEDYPSMIAIHAALLARAAGKPVRLAYDRHEDIVGTTKRHPSRVHHRTAVDGDGRLLAMDIEVVLDGGAYRTLSPVVLSRSMLHATGPYRCPAVRLRGQVVRTNTATNGAFRGFGAPQSQFAVERQMDRIAQHVGLDPLEIRRRNVLRPGDTLATGQVLDESTAAEACLEKVAELTDFARRRQALDEERRQRGGGEPWRGLGLSLYFHGAGFTGNGERKMRSPVEVRLLEDGRLQVRTAMVDMGQGCDTLFPQMACEASGLTPEQLHFHAPDTAEVPDSGPTVASRTTLVVGRTVAEAVVQLRDRVLDWWGRLQGREALEVQDGWVTAVGVGSERWEFPELARRFLATGGKDRLTHRYEPPADQDFDETTYQGAAYPTFGWGADVVEVEVDPDTLAVRPVHVTAVCDVGKAIHPTLCRGQVEGGTLQAVAWGLLEEVKLEDGRYLNDRLATYIIPTFQDTPQIDVHLLEFPWKGGPFGAKGVGELPMDGGAPAAVAAVEHATGIPAPDLPATPERLLAWQEELAEAEP